MTAGFSRAAVTTMAGLKLTPDISIDEIGPAGTSILILPGGDMWEKQSHEKLKVLLRRLHEEAVPIGAICAATLEIARAGLTQGIRHTSNAREYLQAMAPDYKDGDLYSDELAVADNDIITGSGLGCVEFAREVIRRLNLYSEADARLWFEMFKNTAWFRRVCGKIISSSSPPLPAGFPPV